MLCPTGRRASRAGSVATCARRMRRSAMLGFDFSRSCSLTIRGSESWARMRSSTPTLNRLTVMLLAKGPLGEVAGGAS